MAITGDCLLVEASVGHPGSMHDERQWRPSKLKRKLDQGVILNRAAVPWRGIELP